jgi:hypothetical protein
LANYNKRLGSQPTNAALLKILGLEPLQSVLDEWMRIRREIGSCLTMQAAWHGKAPQWCDAVTLFRARTYKVGFVNSAVHVRFAPKATELLRDSKMTRGANNGSQEASPAPCR